MFIVGIKSINLPAIFNYELYSGEGAKPYNAFYFLTLFWIPIIPIWYRMPTYKFNSDDFYKRDLAWRGWLLNHIITLFCLLSGLLLLLMLGEGSGLSVTPRRIYIK